MCSLNNKSPILILTALKKEKNALLGNASIKKLEDNGIIQCHVTGMGRQTLDFLENNTDLIRNCRGVLNTGVCGSISADFSLLDIVFPQAVSHVNSRTTVNIPDGRKGHLITVDTPVFNREEKLGLNGDLIDMESHYIAKYCTNNRFPFHIVKAVSDTLDTNPDKSAHMQNIRNALEKLMSEVSNIVKILVQM